MEIMNIAVAEHLQGKGIGKKLLRHAVETIKDMVCQNLKLVQAILVFHNLFYIKNVDFVFFY